MVNVLIYGAGAIGSFVGYLLSEPAEEGAAIENVALLGRRSHVQKIINVGLRIDYPGGQSSLMPFKYCFSCLEELRDSNFFPDVVILCVKSYSLERVLDEITACDVLKGKLKDSDFILLMNGMGNRVLFNPPSGDVFEGVTSIGVNFPKDGQIELKGIGKTVLEDGINAKLKRFMKERFEEKGFEIEFSRNFKSHQWNKLFVNSVINPITALTRKQNGIVLSLQLEDTVEKIVEECVSVACKEECEADKNGVLNFVYSVSSRTKMNTSSMLQDVLKGRTTEIDSINGYVVRMARKHAIPVPVNEAFYALIKSVEHH
jgi:2-dehydropantoate 2-reductase